jgi:hypothetical protein
MVMDMLFISCVLTEEFISASVSVFECYSALMSSDVYIQIY